MFASLPCRRSTTLASVQAPRPSRNWTRTAFPALSRFVAALPPPSVSQLRKGIPGEISSVAAVMTGGRSTGAADEDWGADRSPLFAALLDDFGEHAAKTSTMAAAATTGIRNAFIVPSRVRSRLLIRKLVLCPQFTRDAIPRPAYRSALATAIMDPDRRCRESG